MLLERNMEDNESFKSILKYFEVCSRAGSASWAERARKILMAEGMTDYEATLILNISPERHIDAKALIPSLSRFENYVIDHILNEIAEMPDE